MNEFHFLRPTWLLLLAPFFVLVILLVRKKSTTNVWGQICSKDLMPFILTENPTRSSSLLYGLVFLTLSLLVIGFAGPAWQTLPQPLLKSQSSLVIVLDLSSAMDAEDIKPSRLKRAIYKINDLLNVRKDGQTALMVFSGDPFVVTPLTDDVETIKALLPVLGTNLMPSSGQNIFKAIRKASELFAQAGRSNGSILLVTSALPLNELTKIAESALKEGVSISVLGVGTDENAPIPKRNGGFVTDDKGALVITTLAKDNLSQLANLTGGKYVTISTDDTDIQALAHHFSDIHQLHTQEEITLKQTKWHDQGYLFVILALPFFSLLFRRGVLLTVCFLIPQTLQASSWDDFFKTRDQQAETLFHQANYQEAKNLFQNRNWQGATNFRLGDYEAAAGDFQDNKTPDGLYNFGTAKAKQGDFDSALKAYNAVLEIQPDHEDALYNKKLIEDWQKQKQQQDQQQNQDQQNQDQSNDQQQKDQQQNQSSEQSEDQQNQDQSNGQQQKNQQQNQNKKDQEQQQNQNQQKDPNRSQSKNQQQDDQKSDPQNQQKQEQRNQNEKKPQTPKGQDPDANLDGNEKKDEAADKELQNQYKNQLDKEIDQNEQSQTEQPIAQNEMSPDDQQRQIDDRWLQRIPDDPGALLRRKFLYQYKNQK